MRDPDEPVALTDSELDRDIPDGRLRATLRSGLVWSLSGQWGAFLIQTLTTVVLARLLTPADFGLIGMALTLTVFVDQFRTLGLSQAVVQRQHLTWAQISALFWVNSLVGVLLGIAVAAAGPLLAAFYGRSELTAVCAVLGATYVVAGIGVQHNALLVRRLRFKTIALRTSLARWIASACGVLAAVAGAGYWSLVVIQVVFVAIATIVVWSAAGWRPGPPRQLQAAFPLLRFGAGVSAASFLNTVSRNADNVLIGRYLGAPDLGLYTRAYSLLMVPLRQLKGPLGGVLEPLLSAVQGEPDRYRRLYCGSVKGLAHVGMPVVAVLAVASDEVVLLLLGEQWFAAVPVFRILAVAGLFQFVSSTTGWLYVSSGRSGAFARWAAVSSGITVASFAVGVQWGILGVAVAYAAGQTAMLVPSFYFAARGGPVRTSDILQALRRPLLLALLAGAAAAAGRAALVGETAPVVLLGAGSAGLAAWVVATAAWPAARREVLASMAILRPNAGRPFEDRP